ncbi:uncharacterized protein GBIM_01909 [Gryllus bimaculatus]|nr:uncharacterized protein GBIM_01909 [Gryllus bimaculatus]
MAPNTTAASKGAECVGEGADGAPAAVSSPAAPEAPRRVWVDKYNYTGKEIIWLNTIAIVLFHVLTVVLTLYVIRDITVLTGLWSFGVTGGVHRMWTHRSYKATFPMRVLLMLCFATSGQNSIFDWVRDHRVHHKYSESDADPHDVRRGFFFSHVGWLMMRKHPEVRRRGAVVDMSDILQDPVAAFQIKYHLPLKILMCLVIPVGVPVLLWGENFFVSFVLLGMARYMFGLNFTWLVNSAAHMFGNKPFDKRIASAENRLVSVVAMGEGWHNYHHVFPWDYKAAELPDTNLTLHILHFFKRIGWAYQFKSAPQSLVQRVTKRYGDGSHPKYGCATPEVPIEALDNPEIVDRLYGDEVEEAKEKCA